MTLIESVFNHLVLPPKLPAQEDVDIEDVEADILTRLIDACGTLGTISGEELARTWLTVGNSLRVCRDLNSGRLERATLLREFGELDQNLLILHVTQQNAALFVRRQRSEAIDTVIFEVTEASPRAKDVLATDNALQWDFPGRAAEIPAAKFFKQTFQDSLATLLEKASVEDLGRFAARSSKAGVSVAETRDTTDPSLISQMLLPLLEAVGSPIDVLRIRKRVRDDVNIDAAELPWRRLPLWLVLRVASQRQLCLALGNDIGRACYKFLMCTVLAELLRDCTGQLAPALTMILCDKLCRRLAKLEMDKARAPSARPTYDGLFDSVGVMATKIIEQSSEQIRSAWDRLKRSMTRPVQVLPQRADNLALRLSLPLSNSHLSGLIAANKQRLHGTKLRMAPPPLEGSLRQVMLFTDRYFKLAQIELGIERDPRAAPGDAAGCKELAGSIRNFMAEVGDAYEADPEQMSLFILNVFDLWVRMDKCAARACPLLLDYAPVFSPELLDVLQLPTLSSLRRLQDIQTYLLTRHENCTFHDRTILQLGPDCFAAQYAERSDQLRDLREEIESASAKSRHKKEREWKEACEAYDDLCQKIAESVCICTTKYDGSRNGKGCKKCGGYARRNRMKIAVHEDRLPKDNIKAAAVVFELQIPGFLAAYRNATFRILIDLGYPSRPATSSPPAALLRGYPPLQAYARPTPGGVVLASAKKSFLQTHYKISKLKGDVSKVILPLGLDFSYYDTTSGVWLKDLDKPTTFQHVCGIRLPRCLSTVIPSSPHPAPVIPGPQSYDIIASQTRCPQDTSVHEFMGYQRLLSGESTRWLTMLVELGASNLNFSAKDTMLLLNDLAIQAGPAASGECLRRIHVAFRDGPFCERLAEQISNRLHGISASWREVHCMELLLTLSLRLFSLTSGRPREAAEQLLKAARELTLQWVVRLREESINAGDADAAERAATYGMWASLLCRRTFAALVESGSEMAGEDLCSFVQASVALQQNLVVDLTKLPRVLKNMLIRDVKMVHALRPALEDSIARNPDSLGAAINETWCDSSNSTGREFSPWRALEPPYDRWFVSAVSSSANPYYVPQAVHYNFIEGHLLLDGKPLGRLPLDIRNSEDVRELFENQHLLTFPSSLDGMSHALATRIKGNEVHFGHRGDAVIIRALYRGDLLEYVPRRVFIRGETADLPLGLVDNCVHWLNHRTKRLEIRRKPSVWKTRQRDWNLNVVTGRAQRGNVFLVDPQSQLCQSVAAIFRHFEDPRRLTVYQPTAGALSVEMRHLELSFFVNGGGLLQCRELREEIDPDQDAGTLYGFQSAIVLRGVANPECRSVIAPLGRLAYKRHGMHVAVRSSSTNDYGRFIIDDVLGRLSCAPEPRLLFAKAQFHALTSSFVPDPLTGRTGTEEALHILSSGSCQPWTVLGESPVAVLHAIQALSPGRAYYPKDQRRLQAVTWDEHLPLTTQDDRFEPLVQAILAKSDRLKAFTAPGDACSATAAQTPIHLRNRGRTRRLLYERRTTDVVMPTASCDRIYTPRDRDVTLPQASNVYRTARLLLERPLGVSSEKKLADILQSWSVIGGFQDNSDRSASCLSDLMEDDIGPQWGALLNLCRRTDDGEPYELVFRLGLLAFGTKPDMHAIRSLAAFGTIDELKTLEQPSGACFTGFKAAESPQLDVLQDLIEMDHPRSKATRSSRHQEDLEAERGELALFLLQQWPCPAASLEGFTPTTGTRLSLKRVSVEWQRLYQNWQLSKYVMRAQEILDAYRSHADGTGPRQWKPAEVFCAADRGAVVPALSCIVKNPGPIPSGISHPAGDVPGHSSPIDSCNRCPGMECSLLRGAMITREAVELGSILGPFISSDDALRSQYGGDLQESLCAFMHARSRPTTCDAPRDINVTDADIVKARTALRDRLEQIQARFRADDNRYPWLQRGGMWPCITTSAILELIRSSSNHDFGCGMREALVSYGVQVTGLQRLVRLRDAQLREDHGKVQEEWLNAGHDNWNPLECPDWLLFEVDSNILIRPEQVDVARAIISPASGSNSSLQMNMGKGKTSCVVPMAVAVLANKTQLARLAVPTTLLLQTAQTIQQRLGGLVGREIRHVPFSRRTSTAPDMLRLYSQHHHEILSSSGIMLTTPEHILSYKLSGLQCLADSRLDEARDMVRFQSWLDQTSRLVIDEADVALAVKTRLIYPSGPQISVDGHPHRWLVAQALLALVEGHVPDLQRDFPRSIEVVTRPGGFPIMHFLHTDVEDALIKKITNDVCDGRIALLRPDKPASGWEAEIRHLLSARKIEEEMVERVSASFADAPSAKKIILLLRGLLFHGILLLCLKRRWNVQYGLDARRDPIAVPFDAKGVPSEQSEFGHPDVAILLTCLAFYYAGLDVSQFQESLQRVLKSDDPAIEYENWTQGADSLPESLRHWNVVNGDDQGQTGELWQHLRLSRSVLDYYMNSSVFPMHARQFATNLQASGWDIPVTPQLDASGGSPRVGTTGFSGTNDNKTMLPLNIRQDDLPGLRQTNAEVLTYLLQGRNRRYCLAAERGRRLTSDGLLRRITGMGIRILIDAGAYILEMDNRSLVKAWLDIDTKAKGALYFGADNRAWIQYRGGKEAVPLLATPFAESLEECLVYFDEAHTRGIDLKLPKNSTGALTLAPGQTKDQTVQAGMRMRYLGTSQCIVFFAPPEVNQNIIDVVQKRCGPGADVADINSSHVVMWLLEQTCCANDHLKKLYLAQGADYCHSMDAQWRNPNFLTEKRQRQAYLEVIQHPGHRNLDQLYGTLSDSELRTPSEIACAEFRAYMEKLGERTESHVGGGYVSALDEVEQERQVECQIEEVRQVQRRIHYTALTFPGLHLAISHFVQTGELEGNSGYEHVFAALGRTGVGQRFQIQPTRSRLFISTEFMRTAACGPALNDDFLRPVDWVLWNPAKETGIIIIPEEAEKVAGMLRTKRPHPVHLITYASPVTKSMLHFSRLGYYALPQLPPSYVVPFWLSTEVALFAGRLYLDFVEYQAVERFLHLAGSNPGAPNAATELSVEDPINFTREWLTLRRKGQDITHTPMGYVCSGRRLHRAHPFFIAPGCKARQNGGIQAGNQSGGECSEVDGDENDDEGFA